MNTIAPTYDLMLELPLLDAKSVTVYRDEFEDLYLRTGDGKPTGPLTVHCAQPIMDIEGMLIFRDSLGAEIGVLRRLSDLPSQSLAVVRDELKLAYLTPVITSVHSVDSRSYFPHWDVQTDAGRRSFEVRSSGMDIRILPDGRVFLRDADANRYWIPNIAALDATSRAAIEEFI